MKKSNLMSDRKGWVRILEAAVAIMLIFGFMLYLRAKVEQKSVSDQMYEMTHRVLSEISANETLRNEILGTSAEKPLTNSSLDARITKYGVGYSFNVCGMTESCSVEALPKDKEIFADAIIINPKKLALFVWIK